jgi:hypothetical protein
MAVGLVPMGWVPTRLCELPMTCSAALRREPQLKGTVLPAIIPDRGRGLAGGNRSFRHAGVDSSGGLAFAPVVVAPHSRS